MEVNNMVKVKKDMTGWVMSEYGVPESRLTVVKQVEDYVNPYTNKHHARWLCFCKCGSQKPVIALGSHLRNGNTTSCGCIMKEKVAVNGHNNKKYNQYNLSGECGIGWTTNTNREFYFDLEDYDKIKDYCWFEHIRNGNFSTLQTNDPTTGKLIKMHTLLGFKGYDHIDRNELNNRKNNLRHCTQKENIRNSSIRKDNTSGVIGVRWDTRREKWYADIQVDNKHKFLGYFQDKSSAIQARLKGEIKYFGEFAPQRHLFEQYGITEQND
jgi:hypothetical protein